MEYAARLSRSRLALRSAVPAVAAILMSAIVAVLLLEVLAQLWVRSVARRGKLFTPDTILGWKPFPNLSMVRRNADGEEWRVITDSQGWRQPTVSTPGARRRIIVLGDSFAFGEGVAVERRFDQLLGANHAEWELRNFGVMGYGTDQQLLALDVASVRPNDAVLLLTYQNDMIDVLRPRFAGRAKPYYEMASDSIVLRLPSIRWRERVRDWSYLAALILARRERPAHDYRMGEWRHGVRLYHALVRAAAETISSKGARFIVAHHGDSLLIRGSGLAQPYSGLDSIPGLTVVSLDESIAVCGKTGHQLRDGHWNALGHRCAAKKLNSVLSAVLGSAQLSPQR